MTSGTGCLSTPSVKVTSTLEGSWKCVDLGKAREKCPQINSLSASRDQQGMDRVTCTTCHIDSTASWFSYLC